MTNMIDMGPHSGRKQTEGGEARMTTTDLDLDRAVEKSWRRDMRIPRATVVQDPWAVIESEVCRCLYSFLSSKG